LVQDWYKIDTNGLVLIEVRLLSKVELPDSCVVEYSSICDCKNWLLFSKQQFVKPAFSPYPGALTWRN
jgi:hypothetical protein